MMDTIKKAIAYTLLSVISQMSLAGGPLAINTTIHTPITYSDGGSNITINYDKGDLGIRNNADAAALIDQARAIWNNVASSTVNLGRAADLTEDVDLTNVVDYIDPFDGLSPIIYDTDGSITDAYFGVDAKEFILGFAGSDYLGASYNEGLAVINGYLTDFYGDNVVETVMAHELGHLIGLDHTQLDGDQGLPTSNYPLMYPIAYRSSLSLHDDDVIAVSTLYPAANNNTLFGTLSGSFTQADTSAIRGANIWVQETTTNKVYSTISDYLININGDFTLMLPPGTYTIHAESIDPSFTGGSGVGPYSFDASDISFVAPHPLTPVVYGGGSPAQVTITAGNTRTINFSLSGVIPVIDSDSDSDGVNDIADNCPTTANPDQANFDGDSMGDVCDTDDDDDGLTDLFETLYGLNPLDATGVNGAAGDPDGDSFTNLEEQTAGTDASAATGTTSNPGLISFSSATYSVSENVGVANITVTRTGGSVGIVTVLCFSNDGIGSATAGIDYTSTSVTLTWADGDSTDKTCEISIIDDTIPDSGETLQLDISNPTGSAKLGTISTAILTMLDIDGVHIKNDFNGDGKADILWRNTSNGGVLQWLMSGSGVFNTYLSTLPATRDVIAIEDFNGDGKTDILLRDTNNGGVYQWLMNGNVVTNTFLGFLPTTWILISTDDFNGDGKADILWRDSVNGGVIQWLINGNSISNTYLGTIPLTRTIVSTDDFNGDGNADILWRDSTNGGVIQWLMNGNTINNTYLGTVLLTHIIVSTDDFDGDGNADILWRNSTNGGVIQWLMNGNVFNNTYLGTIPQTRSIVSTNDFNGDGTTDILWRDSVDGGVNQWLMNGNTINNTYLGTIPLARTIVSTDDFNGDGNADILWRDSINGGVIQWLMNGNTINNTYLGTIPLTRTIVDTDDYNGDGKIDILWRDSSNSGVIQWLMNGNVISGTYLGTYPNRTLLK